MDEAERKAYAKGWDDAIRKAAEVAETWGGYTIAGAWIARAVLKLEPEGQSHDG